MRSVKQSSHRFAAEHLLQLFDDQESFTSAVARFVQGGLASSHTSLVVISAADWTATRARLRRSGAPVDSAVATGRVVVRDAAVTLAPLLAHAMPDAALFDRYIGDLIRTLAARGPHLQVFGAMVDVLAADGRLRAAQQLEDLWNTLAAQIPFSLSCGYNAAHFGDPRTGRALRDICRAHSEVLANPRDVLGSFLVGRYAASDAG
jgi:hypothetical protein